MAERSLSTTIPMQYFLPGQNIQPNKLSPPLSTITDEIKEPLSKRIKIDDGSDVADLNISSNQNTSLLSSTTSTVISTTSNKFEFELENCLGLNGAQNESSKCENSVPFLTVKNENQSVEEDKEDGEKFKIIKSVDEVVAASEISSKSDTEKVDDKVKISIVKDEASESNNDDKLQGTNNSTTKTKAKKKKSVNKVNKVKGKAKTSKGNDDSGETKKKRTKKKKKKVRSKNSESPEVPENEDESESESTTNKEGSTESNTKKKNRAAHLRKNIREIISATELEEETLAAQREEAERRARVNLKLQQQQQLNLVQALTRTVPQTTNLQNDIEELAGISQQQQQLAPPRVPTSIIDEVTLSSDDELPAIPEFSRLKNSLMNFHPKETSGPFRSSGGIMTKHDGEEEHVISLTSPSPLPSDEHGRDSDSSDDCVVISPPSFQETVDQEGKEDENNVPDEFGRVLVNVAHPDEDEDIFLAPQVARAMKPHQIGGIRFLYDNVVESPDRFETSNGFGCILAHSMGLGKTIQAVSFCDIFLRYTCATKVLIIVPINTIQNWVNEFNYWIPPEESLQSENSVPLPSNLSAKTGADKKVTKRKSKVDLKLDDLIPNSNNNNNEESGISSHLSNSSSSSPSPRSPSQSSYLQQTSVPELQVPQTQEEKTEQFGIPPISTVPQVNVSNENSTIGIDNSNNNNIEEKTSKRTGVIQPRNFQVFLLNETVKTLSAREKIIEEWDTKGGVLLLGYEMYRMLALKRLKRSSKKKLAAMDEVAVKNRLMEQMSLDHIYSCIVNPGPDLVICDEGHRIKNSGASISQALKAIKTRRRLVLTGYPLQNNLMEYWCMVDFVRPNYLGTKVEFSNMFERPISNGQCVDSSNADKKLMRYRSHVLHTLLEGFVQRRSHLVLQSALPLKEEWVFFLKMTSIQYALYKEFIRYLKEERQEKEREKNPAADTPPSTNPIKAFAVCCKIWNHPDALYNVVKKKNLNILDDLDLEDMATDEQQQKVRAGRKPKPKDNSGKDALSKATSSSVPSPTNSTDFNNFNSDLLGLSTSMANIPATVAQALQRPQNQSQSSCNMNNPSTTASDGRSISLDWAIPIFRNYTSEVLENGVKFQLLFVILEEVVRVGDKLLVFSQSLLTLDLIELFLGKKFNWKKNKEYFRLDGSTSGLDREKLIYAFNEKEGIHLFLVSTRAGSLGINLIGANRVIVFDASWNPCHDSQAVCRVYRYGQKKECKIYRFVTDCSLEKRIYDRQINKRGMADRVVDEMNPETLLQSRDVSSFLVLDHEQMDALQTVNHDFDLDKFSDPVLRNVLNRCGDRLTKEPFEHESLLIDRKETKLSANEKRQAHRNYQQEKAGSNGSGYSYNRPSYAAFYQQQQQQPEPQSLGVPIHPSFSSSNLGMNSSSSLGYNNYNNSMDNRNLPYMDHHVKSVGSGHRPFQDQMIQLRKIQQQRLMQQQQKDQYETQRQKNLNFPFQALKDRGIDVQSMLVKKDAYMKDPAGGAEIYLRAGEKIHIFRSKQGIYFRVPNGRIISIKQINSSLLPKGLSLSDNLTEEQIQTIVFSLLRPAGKLPPPYFNSCLNSNGPKPEIPQFFGGGNSSLNIFNKTNKPPPPLQKLPPTVGILPSYQNHQITNSRKAPSLFASGGDVTIWRKNSDASKSRGGKSGMTPSPPPTPTTLNYHPILSKNPQSTTNNTGSGRKDSDVEVIEFHTHFGEILNPRMSDNMKNLKIAPSGSSSLNALLNQNTTSGDHSRRRKDQLNSRTTYSDSPLNTQDNLSSSDLQFNSQSRSRNTGAIDPPDMSITTIASPSAQSNNNNFSLLNLGNLLSVGNDSARNSPSSRSSFTSPSKSLSTPPGVSSESRRSIGWDQHSGCDSASNSGSDQNSNNSNNCPDEDNLESLFWSLTREPSGLAPKVPGSNNSVIGQTTLPTTSSLSSEIEGMLNDDDEVVGSSWSPMNGPQSHNLVTSSSSSRRSQSSSSSVGQQGVSRYDFDSELLVSNMMRGYGAGTPYNPTTSPSPRGGTNSSITGILSGFSSPGSMNNQSGSSSGGLHKTTNSGGGNFPFPLSNSSSQVDVFGNVFESAVTPPESSGGILGNYDDFLGAAGSRVGGVYGITRTPSQIRPVNISHQQHLQNMINPGQYYNNSLNQPGDNIGNGPNSHNFPTTNLFNFNLNNN